MNDILAFPGETSPEGWLQQGMSLRDYFAAHLSIDDLKLNELEFKELMGEPYPIDADWIVQFKFSLAAEAKIRFLKADAMLAAGEKGWIEK